MSRPASRREFLRRFGLSAAAFPFLCNLPSLGFASTEGRKKRLIIMFSPNGIVPSAFWPEVDKEKDIVKEFVTGLGQRLVGPMGSEMPLTGFKEILTPLEPFRDKVLTLHGVCDRVRGDGDAHMRGIGCLLTGIELFPGNIQGGSDTPAGWSSGHSIDQEIRNYLQSSPATQTRFGSLEFGVVVPDRADTWTRMVYAGPNKPITPIDDPYQMLTKMYGNVADRETLRSVLDDLKTDLDKLKTLVGKEDQQMLEEQATFVRDMEKELSAAQQAAGHAIPVLEPGIRESNDNLPKISQMQVDLLVHSLANDFTRVATLQFTNSVGQAKMTWLGIDENHHTLSHEPDSNADAQTKLIKINKWYCEQLAYLCKRLSDTPEPGGNGTLLDNTQIVWTNELGKGNSHTLDNIPFVLVGGGFDYKGGRALEFGGVPHNRLLMSLAHGMGHHLERFGNPDHCSDGPLGGLV